MHHFTTTESRATKIAIRVMLAVIGCLAAGIAGAVVVVW